MKANGKKISRNPPLSSTATKALVEVCLVNVKQQSNIDFMLTVRRRDGDGRRRRKRRLRRKVVGREGRVVGLDH